MATHALLNMWLSHLIRFLIETQNAIFLQRTKCLLSRNFWSESFLVTEALLLTEVTTNTHDLAIPVAQPVQFGGQQLKGDIASRRSKHNEKGKNILK